METVVICSVGIYRCEKSSSIKINMNLTQDFDMLHSDMYYSHNGIAGELQPVCDQNRLRMFCDMNFKLN